MRITCLHTAIYRLSAAAAPRRTWKPHRGATPPVRTAAKQAGCRLAKFGELVADLERWPDRLVPGNVALWLGAHILGKARTAYLAADTQSSSFNPATALKPNLPAFEKYDAD